MHRAGQRCFELLALIGSPQLLYQSYSPPGQDSWGIKTLEESSWGITLLEKLMAADES